MRNKRILLSLVIILSIMLTTIPAFSACSGKTSTPEPSSTTPQKPATKEVLIRITTPVPPGDSLAVWAQEGMDRFNARANGAYKMQVFTSGQLASMPESLDAIRTGSVEGGVIPLAAFQGTVPEFGLPELAFLWSSDKANDYAMPAITEVFTQLLQEKCNQRSLGCMFIGTLDFISKKPIKTLEDVDGMIIGCDAPPMADLIKALGGSGIVVDFAEDYSNLQKGVIDGKTVAPQYLLIAKLYEVAKYFTIFHGLGSLYSININSDIYNGMPDDLKKILDEEMATTAQDMSNRFMNLFYEKQDECKAAGVEYYFLPQAERERWKEVAYPGTLAVIEQSGEVGQKIKQIADEANAKFPYQQ
jgi:TRAP-type C4-dicarboxylate transport system substrate-binding protein